MEKSTRKPNDVFLAVSEALDAPVKFSDGPEGKLEANFDLDAILSKLYALAIYMGATVPGAYAPPYNRVHADVEFWKREFAQEKEEPPKEEPKPEEAPTVPEEAPVPEAPPVETPATPEPAPIEAPVAPEEAPVPVA